MSYVMQTPPCFRWRRLFRIQKLHTQSALRCYVEAPSLGTSLKPCIRRLIVYTDTLAEWVYGYVDLAWLCLRIRRLGGSCLRILSTDTTGIHVALGGRSLGLTPVLTPVFLC